MVIKTFKLYNCYSNFHCMPLLKGENDIRTLVFIEEQISVTIYIDIIIGQVITYL